MTLRHLMFGAILAASTCSLSLAGPVADGDFSEWSAATLRATDTTGDAAAGITPRLDIVAMHTIGEGSRLSVMIEFAAALNLASGALQSPSLRLQITAGTRSLWIDFRTRKAYRDGNTAVVIPWPQIDFVSQPTTASTRHEMRIDLASIGVTAGSTVSLQFTGSDALAAPVSMVMGPADTTPVPRRTAARASCSPLRIASFNTYFSALIDTARVNQAKRLIDAVDADVYVFQEEYSSNASQVTTVMNAVDPLENGQPWTVIRRGELVITSPHVMLPLPLPANSNYYAAVVRIPGMDVLIVNNHMKCCGYAGDTSDNTRIVETNAAVALINDFRAGALGATLSPYRNVPVIVVGDWNLVGSTTPADLWAANPGPALTRSPIRNLIGKDVVTWSSPNGLDFWPGVLDVLMYSRGSTFLRNSFLLDSTLLNPSELAALALQSADSLVSDHRMLVMDFGPLPPSDFNHDGFLDFTDFDDFVGAFEAGSTAADFNADGFLDFTDFDLFVTTFEAGC
jgi:hypothetical protein